MIILNVGNDSTTVVMSNRENYFAEPTRHLRNEKYNQKQDIDFTEWFSDQITTTLGSILNCHVRKQDLRNCLCQTKSKTLGYYM